MSAVSHSLRNLVRCALLFLLIGTLPLAHARTRVLKYAGVNLSGAEFASSKKPGVLNKDYMYPATSDYTYFAGVGMNTIRLPILWERLQPSARGELDPAQLALVQQAVARAKASGMYLVLDIHNYAKYNGYKIGSSEVQNATFADLWRRLALVFRNDNAVIFGLMNEPNGVSASGWAGSAQAAIDAIRATGANNLILVPGVLWTGAHSWSSLTSDGYSNATALASIYDPSTTMRSRCISIWTQIPAARPTCASIPASVPIVCAASPTGYAPITSAVSLANSAVPAIRPVIVRCTACSST